MKEYICIDIGGTSIKHGRIREDGSFIATGERETRAWLGGPAIMEKVTSIIEEYLKDSQAEGICISTAGMVDCEKGEITYSAPLIPNYTGTGIKKIIEDRFRLPCEVENDVNCAGLAENYAGASKGCRISLCLTIGTGIGGAIIIDNKVFHGFSNSACEVGYMNIGGQEFQKLGAASVLVKKVAERKGCGEEEINGKKIFEMAAQKDEDCIRAIDEMADVLGLGIANICYVLNPEIVVLGGGIMAQKDYLYDRIRSSLDRHLIPSVASKTKLAFAENQNLAGMLGAFYHYKSRKGER